MGSDGVMWVNLPNSFIYFENTTILFVVEEPIILPTLPPLSIFRWVNVGKKVLCFNAILLFLNPENFLH